MPSPTDHTRNERLIKLWASHPDIPVSTIAQRFSITADMVRKIIGAARAAGDMRVEKTRAGATR